MARKTILNEELIEKFAAEIQDGLPVVYTCDLLGVSDTSYQNWMKRGKEDYEAEQESVYNSFFVSIKKAYALYVKNAKNEMRSKTNGWQSIAWWLERTNPFFMPKQQIQADDDGKVNVIIGGKPKKQ